MKCELPNELVETTDSTRGMFRKRSAAFESSVASTTLRSASPVPPQQAAEALRAATERLGGKGKIALQGDRATLTFSSVPFEALRNWIGEARGAARARPIEAQLLKGANGYSGAITVVLSGTS